jgi:hypothetical protein
MEAFYAFFDKQIGTIVKMISHFERVDFPRTWVCRAVIC